MKHKGVHTTSAADGRSVDRKIDRRYAFFTAYRSSLSSLDGLLRKNLHLHDLEVFANADDAH